MEVPAFFLGCPIWAHAEWVGRFYRSDARRSDYLPQYCSVFSAVEGNSTFYGLPPPESIARWAVGSPAGFRFCFKFPRTVTHEARLEGCDEDIAQFLERIAPLGERVGPLLVQLPAAFGPARLAVLDAFLGNLPAGFRYAVEVRHRTFFAEGKEEEELDAVLRTRGADRVLFDTTGLFSAGTPLDDSTSEALTKKPRVPRRRTVTAQSPIVRFVGDPDLAKCRAPLRAWAGVVREWMDKGLTPFFFAHHANDTLSPNVARIFHEELVAVSKGMPKPPAWPIELQQAGIDSDDPDGQMAFFP